MEFVFFISGLAFFILGFSIFIYPKRTSRFALAKNLWLISIFALLHGVNDWLEMFPAGETDAFKVIHFVTLPLSFYFLVQFGISSFASLKNREPGIFNAVPLLLLAAWAAIIVPAGQKHLTSEIISRYLLGIPGTGLAVAALLLHANQIKTIAKEGPVRHLRLAAAGFFFYGVLSAVIVPLGHFFPASVLDYRVPPGGAGYAVQLLRAASVVFVAYWLVRVLGVFELESINALRKARAQLENRVGERTAALELANARLRQSEEKYKNLIELTPDIIYQTSTNGIKTFVNDAFYKVLEATPGEVIGEPWDRWVHMEDRAKSKEAFTRMIEQDVDTFELENRLVSSSGKIIYMLHNMKLLRDEHGTITGVQGIAREITRLKNTEGQISQALKEKEMLLRELYHRTKNNMQVISSLVSLQSASLKDKTVLDILKDTQDRIRAMSIVHEQLYKSQDLASLDIKDYMEVLANVMVLSYQSQPEKVSLLLDIESFALPIDVVMPCGLVLNELISNSLKYAFPGDRSGAISIYMRRAAENQVEFVYADDGIGFKLPGDMKKVETLGLRLVNNLVTKQLGGTLEARSNGRTEFRIRFKLEPDPATR